jgi:tyrosyl-tRNA synthetase
MYGLELLTRNVEEVIETDSLTGKLKSGRKLRVKLGADPTAPDLHLGHAVVLRKMREFQDLGHRAVFIIGDYTAKIGDPSGKSKTRPPLSLKEIKKNAQTYFKQAGKIIDIKKAEIRYNSEWFSKMKLDEFIKIAGNFSMQRIMDREDFKKRIQSGDEVAHHETLYQIMQAYDSVAVKADVELGGRDQRLNLLAGRELQRKMGLPEQDLVIAPLLIGIDGKEKMSKSLGNYIGISEDENKMFGKIMSIPDSLIILYFKLAAFVPPADLSLIEERLKKENPRDVKLDLAEKIVSIYHGEKSAESSRNKFLKVFSQKEYVDLPAISIASGKRKILDVVFDSGFVSSKSEARRLISQRAVEIDGKVIDNPDEIVDVKKGMKFRIGKKKFFKIK